MIWLAGQSFVVATAARCSLLSLGCWHGQVARTALSVLAVAPSS